MTTLPTIGDYYNQYDLNVSCYECNRYHTADWHMLAKKFDANVPIQKLEKVYKCSVCGSSEAVRIRIGLKTPPSGQHPNH